MNGANRVRCLLDTFSWPLLPSQHNRIITGDDRDEYAASGAAREPEQVRAGARAASRMDPGAADRKRRRE